MLLSCQDSDTAEMMASGALAARLSEEADDDCGSCVTCAAV